MAKNYELELASMFTKRASKVSPLEEMSIEEMEEMFYSSAKTKQASATIPVDAVDLADQWGRNLAKEHFEKVAIGALGGALASGLGGLRRGVDTAMNYAMHSSTMNRMGAGAAIGGILGAMKQPGIDPNTGMQKSRMGGAMAGAAMGGLAGYASKGLTQQVSGAKGAVGGYANAAMKRGVMPGGMANPLRRPAAAAGAASAAMPAGARSGATQTARLAPGGAGVTPGGGMIPHSQLQPIYNKIPDVDPAHPVPMIGGGANTASMRAAQVTPAPVTQGPIPRTQKGTQTLNRPAVSQQQQQPFETPSPQNGGTQMVHRPYSSGRETEMITQGLKPARKTQAARYNQKTQPGAKVDQTLHYAKPR